jgi:hypothetical protein
MRKIAGESIPTNLLTKFLYIYDCLTYTQEHAHPLDIPRDSSPDAVELILELLTAHSPNDFYLISREIAISIIETQRDITEQLFRFDNENDTYCFIQGADDIFESFEFDWMIRWDNDLLYDTVRTQRNSNKLVKLSRRLLARVNRLWRIPFHATQLVFLLESAGVHSMRAAGRYFVVSNTIFDLVIKHARDFLASLKVEERRESWPETLSALWRYIRKQVLRGDGGESR